MIRVKEQSWISVLYSVALRARSERCKGPLALYYFLMVRIARLRWSCDVVTFARLLIPTTRDTTPTTIHFTTTVTHKRTRYTLKGKPRGNRDGSVTAR
jgi:hypothetical protein